MASSASLSLQLWQVGSEGIRRRCDLEIRHFAHEPAQRVELLGDLALLDLRLVFLADEADACEIGFIIDDEDSAAFEIRIVRIKKLNYPFQIFRLFLRDNNELAPLLALGELARLLHDVENQDFIFIDELPKIAAKASDGLSRQSLGSFGEDDGYIEHPDQKPVR